MEVLQRQGDVFEVARALGASSRFSRCLYRRQQERYEYANDRDDYEQFHKRKAASRSAEPRPTSGRSARGPYVAEAAAALAPRLVGKFMSHEIPAHPRCSSLVSLIASQRCGDAVRANLASKAR